MRVSLETIELLLGVGDAWDASDAEWMARIARNGQSVFVVDGIFATQDDLNEDNTASEGGV